MKRRREQRRLNAIGGVGKKVEHGFVLYVVENDFALTVVVDYAENAQRFELMRHRGLVYFEKFAQIADAHFGYAERGYDTYAGGIRQRAEKVRKRLQVTAAHIVLPHQTARFVIE